MSDRFLTPSNGLSKTKLEDATALVSDVLSGKTFYSGDDTLKSGTLSLSATASESDVLSGKTFFSGGSSRRTGNLNIADEIMDFLEQYGIARISRTANDEVVFGGGERRARRSSSAKAIYAWMNRKDSYYYGWFCCSLTNGGHTLTATGNYSGSVSKSISTNNGTLYYSIMNQKANCRSDNYVTINGSNKIINCSMIITDTSENVISSNTANLFAYLLKNTH